jgi:hypothetical protein
MESVSSQKFLQFLELANSIDLMAPMSSAKRELPLFNPSAKHPRDKYKIARIDIREEDQNYNYCHRIQEHEVK